MKVVLINPSSVLSGGNDGYSRFVSPIPVLGMAYIGAVLEKNQIPVVVFDQLAQKLTNENLIQSIVKEAPDIIGFSCLTPAMSNVSELVRALRKELPEAKIVFGNTHANVFASEIFLSEDPPDFVVRGEGEETMLELVLAIQQKANYSSVDGLSYKLDGQVYHNKDRKAITDLDLLPFPAWHLFDLSNYKKAQLLCLNDASIVPVQTSRGCPYQCTFCSQDQIFDSVRTRSVENVVDEIERNLNLYGINRFGFIDANFPLSKRYCLDFCDLMIKRNLHKKVKWVTETRVDLVDEELLKKMKDAGLHLVMYGFEVGNQEVLDSINKKTTLDQARLAMKQTKKVGLLTLGLFILGMPGETKETCLQTIEFAKEIDCDIAKFNIAVPLPGSRFFDAYQDEFRTQNPDSFTSWSDWSDKGGDLLYVPDDLSREELIRLQRKAMFRFYVRPKLIMRHIVKGTIPYMDLMYGAYLLITNYVKDFFVQACDGIADE